MAGAAVVAATNTSSDGSFSLTSHNCALPTGIVAGNLLVVVATTYVNNGTATNMEPATPSGWTSLQNATYNDGPHSFTTGLRVFYKIATGSEGSTVTVTWPSASTTPTAVTALSARITGYDTLAPIDASALAAGSGTLPAVTVTAGKTDSLLLRGSAFHGSTVPTAPTGHTDLAGVTQTARQKGSYSVYKTTTSSGSTGTQGYVTLPSGGVSWTVAVAPFVAQVIGAPATLANTPTVNTPGPVTTSYTIGAPAAIAHTPTLGTPTVHQVIVAAGTIDNTPTLYELGGEIRFTSTTITNTPVLYAPGVTAPNTEQRIGEAATIVNTPTLATPAAAGATTPFTVGESEVGGTDLVGGGQAELTGEGGLRLHYVAALTTITNTPTVYTPTVRQVIQLATIDNTPEVNAPRVRTVVAFTPAARILPWGTSRVWNAWVEFIVAGEIIATSTDGTFALVGGTVTEDITRSIEIGRAHV